MPGRIAGFAAGRPGVVASPSGAGVVAGETSGRPVVEVPHSAGTTAAGKYSLHGGLAAQAVPCSAP